MIATKQQEREALQKIRDIVDSLGEDSYIATAFQGCFEDAKDNIENDWACSPYGRWQEAEQKVERLTREVADLETDLAGAQERVRELERECDTLEYQQTLTKNLTKKAIARYKKYWQDNTTGELLSYTEAYTRYVNEYDGNDPTNIFTFDDYFTHSDIEIGA